MNLSMTMLASELKEHYSVEARECSSRRSLSRAVVSRDRVQPQPGEVVCCPVGDDVMCLSQCGTLRIDNCSVEDVFNRVNAVFEQCFRCEQKIILALLSESPWQAVVAAIEEILDCPLYIVDRYGCFLGVTEQYVGVPITTSWMEGSVCRQLNFDAYDIMKHFPLGQTAEIIDPPGKEKDVCRYIQCPLVPSDPYAYVLYVLEWNKSLDESDLQYVDAIQDVIRACLRRCPLPGSSSIGDLFRDLSGGNGDASSERLLWALHQLGWHEDQAFFTITLLPCHAANSFQDRVMMGNVKRILPDFVVFMAGGSVRAIAPERLLDQVDPVVAYLCGDGRYTAGISSCFSYWGELSAVLRQGEMACRFAQDHGQRVISFPDYACELVPYVFMDAYDQFNLQHPAVPALAQYDAAHGTEYLKTLYVFLNNERDISRSATQLNVHRNTLANRMRVIESLYSANWDNCRERIYFLLSCGRKMGE